MRQRGKPRLGSAIRPVFYVSHFGPSSRSFSALIIPKYKIATTDSSLTIISRPKPFSDENGGRKTEKLAKVLEKIKRLLELVNEKITERNCVKKFENPCLAKKMPSDRSRVVMHCGEVFKL